MKTMIIDHQYGYDEILAEGSYDVCLEVYNKEVSYLESRGNNLIEQGPFDVRFNSLKSVQLPNRWRWISIVEDKETL